MMHGRRTAMALLCLAFMALVLLQDAEARKLLWTAQEKRITHGSGTTTTTPPEPCSGRGGGTRDQDQGQQVQRGDTSKWAELHTDYIYTQDVKRNP